MQKRKVNKPGPQQETKAREGWTVQKAKSSTSTRTTVTHLMKRSSRTAAGGQQENYEDDVSSDFSSDEEHDEATGCLDQKKASQIQQYLA